MFIAVTLHKYDFSPSGKLIFVATKHFDEDSLTTDIMLVFAILESGHMNYTMFDIEMTYERYVLIPMNSAIIL